MINPNTTNPNSTEPGGIEARREPTYYAEGGYVWKNPVEKQRDGGGRSITLGFRVCKVCEDLGDDAAEIVAALMNAGEAALAAARPDESLERLREIADRLENHSLSINDGFISDMAQELRALSHTPQTAGVPEGHVERVRHVKRGTEYEVIGEAEAQMSKKFGKWRGLYKGDRITVYRCVETGELYCRFTDEFRDGRFVSLDRATIPQSEEAK